MTPTKRRILNIAGFQAVWIISVLGAASGSWLPGVIALLVHLALHRSVQDGSPFEWRLIALGAAVGGGIDSFLAAVGLFSFSASVSPAWLAPPWLIALWAGLASTLRHALAWCSARYRLSALLGAVFGPIAYVSGAKLGALALPMGPATSAALLALTWAVVFPLLIWFSDSLRAAGSGRELDRGGVLA